MQKALFRTPALIKIACLLLAAMLSILVLNPLMSNPKMHTKTLETIRGNKMEAMTLSGTVTIASTAISALKDDTASAVADELAEFSTPLLIVVCILYFEEFMLTAMEHLSFAILIPIACVVMALYIWTQKKSLFLLAVKLFLISLVCACLIPASAALTSMIEETFSQSIHETLDKVKSLGTVFESMEGTEDQSALTRFFSSVTSGITTLADLAKDILSIFIDAVAILLITSCVIPVLTALLFVWCIKSILNGKMENLEDTAMTIIRRLPEKKKIIITDHEHNRAS